MPRIVALVPLKERSQRCPEKNLTILGSRPLYEYILETLNGVNSIDKVFVFTSSTNFRIPRGFSKKIKFRKRDESLDGDDVTINEVIRDFLDGCDADIVVLAHATSPFLQVKTIEECLKQVVSGEYDSALAASKLQKFGVFQNNPINFGRNKDLPPLQNIVPIVVEQGGLYVFYKENFLEYNTRVGQNPYFHFIEFPESIDIDTPMDFEIARRLLGLRTV